MMVIMERTKVSLSVVGVLLVCATSLASGIPQDSPWSYDISVVDESPRSGPEVIDISDWNSEGGDHGDSFSSFNEVPTTTENERPSSPVSQQIYEAGPSSSSLVPHPEQSLFSSDSSIPVSEVIQTTAKAPEESPFSSVGSMSTFESHVQPIEVIQTTAEIYETGLSSSFLKPHPEQTSFSSDGSVSTFESHVQPIEVIQTTAKAPEESSFSSVSPVPMFEVPAGLIEVIQTLGEVENHSGFGLGGGNGNITYENVPYTIRKRLIHVDSSGGHARVSTA